ncbi:hypothetical protein Tco_1092923 [Tanacetum coccineum]|uniref:Uncharacterized protein n=1 Tax=Tanacetum coccineum TaxID=301880 RepID=A0ABQ5IBK3_9ASTR
MVTSAEFRKTRRTHTTAVYNRQTSKAQDDRAIIHSLITSATPTQENEATSTHLLALMPLDLESHTDENTTPTNALKSTISCKSFFSIHEFRDNQLELLDAQKAAAMNP